MSLAHSFGFGPYAGRMANPDPHLLLRIETKNPIELNDFVSLFVGLGNQFEKFIAHEHPAEKGDVRFYVREVRAGSIIAELVPYAIGTPILGGVMAGIKNANDIAKFLDTFGGAVKRYFKKDGRDEEATKGDLADYLKTVSGIARDPEANLSLAAYDDGKKRIEFEFSTPEARIAESNLIEHRAELEQRTDSDHSRVLMQFTRTDVSHAQAGKRSGERVLIEAVHPKPLPIVFASTLAEERIRHEIAEADDNVYKKAFDVDVNVEILNDRPVAYRIAAVHNVIDLPDDEPTVDMISTKKKPMLRIRHPRKLGLPGRKPTDGR